MPSKTRSSSPGVPYRESPTHTAVLASSATRRCPVVAFLQRSKLAACSLQQATRKHNACYADALTDVWQQSDRTRRIHQGEKSNKVTFSAQPCSALVCVQLCVPCKLTSGRSPFIPR